MSSRPGWFRSLRVKLERRSQRRGIGGSQSVGRRPKHCRSCWVRDRHRSAHGGWFCGSGALRHVFCRKDAVVLGPGQRRRTARIERGRELIGREQVVEHRAGQQIVCPGRGASGASRARTWTALSHSASCPKRAEYANSDSIRRATPVRRTIARKPRAALPHRCAEVLGSRRLQPWPIRTPGPARSKHLGCARAGLQRRAARTA
jgi:hypothetical protein